MEQTLTTKQIKKVCVAPEEWNATQYLYSTLFILNTAQWILLERVLKRFDKHHMAFSHDMKHKMSMAHKCLDDARKWLEAIETRSSCLGKNGEEQFVETNTSYNYDAMLALRVIMATMNAAHYMRGGEQAIVDGLNQLTTGKKRWFPKKLIDTFRLQEDKK